MSKDNVAFYLYFLFIAAVALAVYYPSFQHTFRSDQIVYFANTREHNDVISLCKDYYAYPQVRHYYPGDAFLFRPLVFILLGVEKAFFGTHYGYWHVLGFLLHMLTVWFLFRLLYDLRSGIFAVLASLYYACCYANVEIVIWEHINGYVLFNALIMGSLFYFKRSFDDDLNRVDLSLVLFFLMVACFLHEWGGVFAAIFGICFYFKSIGSDRIQDRKKAGLFFFPGVIYALVYIWVSGHYQTGNLTNVRKDVFLNALQLSNLIHVVRFIPYYFCQLIFNGLYPSLIKGTLTFMDRLTFIHQSVFTAEFLLNFTAVCGVVYFILMGFSRAVFERNKAYILLLTGMIACQIITFPLMRLQTHGESYIFQTNSYYGYFFWSYILAAVFMMVDWSKFRQQGKSWLRTIGIASMIVLILLNAYHTWQLNQDIKTARWAWQQYIDKFNDLIAVHSSETGFSFYVHDDVPIGLKYRINGSMQEQADRLDLASILYYPYYDPQNPKYRFKLGEDGRIVPADKSP